MLHVVTFVVERNEAMEACGYLQARAVCSCGDFIPAQLFDKGAAVQSATTEDFANALGEDDSWTRRWIMGEDHTEGGTR